jgi:UDP-glucose 4-epimerase
MIAWVIGRGGMLGSAVAERLAGSGARVHDASPVPWTDVEAARATLEADAARFQQEAGDGPWSVVWTAGSSVVSSATDATSSELATLEGLLHSLLRHRPPGPGAFFLTSSAGGVYAGSADPPFGADTDPVPISPYGTLKLDQERLATRLLEGSVPLVIGRFSNLYGPRSNSAKGQGLIPQLCLATVRRAPLNLYVSMDTVRDYLYVDDAAAMTRSAVLAAARDQPTRPRIAVLASGQPTTVAQVISTVQNVAHRRVPLALGTHPSAQHQAVDLRLAPSPGLLGDEDSLTPLPNGVKRVFDAIVGRVQ